MPRPEYFPSLRRTERRQAQYDQLVELTGLDDHAALFDFLLALALLLSRSGQLQMERKNEKDGILQ